LQRKISPGLVLSFGAQWRGQQSDKPLASFHFILNFFQASINIWKGWVACYRAVGGFNTGRLNPLPNRFWDIRKIIQDKPVGLFYSES
jgi:hypothetical protein